MPDSLKRKTLRGVAWNAFQRFSVQGVQFLVMLIIANKLGPRAFGLLGMLTIFISVSESIVDSGFSQALVRKRDRTETDNNTVFFFNIVISVVLYLILYAVAPWVSAFYDEPELTSVMRVSCLVVVINSFAIVQRSIYTASIDFRTLAKASLVSALISGAIGIWMAFAGFGVWSLVWQHIIRSIVYTLQLWLYSTWRPALVYSWQSFRRLFAFGSNLLLSGLLDTIYNNIYQITIGKLYSAESLGHFTQAKAISSLPSSNINSVVTNVTYPVLSTIQDENERLSSGYRRLLRVSAFVIFPLMCGLAAVSYPLIHIILGEKWHFVSTLLIPLSFCMMWYPIHALNLNLLKVKGRSDLFLRLEIIKKVLGVTMLVITSMFGVLVMCYGMIVTSLIALFINTYYTGKLFNLGFACQMRDLSATLLTSLLMFGLVYVVTLSFSNEYLQLFIGILVGIVFFFSVSLIFRFKEIDELKALVRMRDE